LTCAPCWTVSTARRGEGQLRANNRRKQKVKWDQIAIDDPSYYQACKVMQMDSYFDTDESEYQIDEQSEIVVIG
jgi:hypothetical protein